MKERKWVIRWKKANDVEEVFKVYCEAYERRFRRKLRTNLHEGVRRNLSHFVQREGAETAKKAIRFVFTSSKMRWITLGSVDAFLANRGNFERYVEPYLDEVAGEQAEWTGPRDEAPGMARW